MTSIPQANPTGAGSDLGDAAKRIGSFLSAPEPQGQLAEKAAPAEANQEQTERQRNERGQFAKQEPETEGNQRSEGADAPEETPAAQSEPSDDSEELPDRLEALAEKIGVDPDKFREHVKASVKINGEERTVNLKELIAGYQKGEDYSRKTAETAEQRKAAEAERTAYQQQREHLSAQLSPLITQLSSLVETDAQRIKAAYDNGDYQEAARIQFESNQRKEQLAAAQREQSRIDEEKQRENTAKLHSYVAEQEAKLLEAKPAWKDIDKGKKELTAIRDYLKSQGVPAQQADSLYEATPLLMAEKAMLWDQLQKAKPGKLQELKAVPKFQKPGPAKAAVDPQKEVVRASFNRLRQTKDWKDAAKLIKAKGIA